MTLLEVRAIVNRMKNTKAMRHMKDDIWQQIESNLEDEEFLGVFKSELKIDYLALSVEEKTEIVERLIKSMGDTE